MRSDEIAEALSGYQECNREIRASVRFGMATLIICALCIGAMIYRNYFMVDQPTSKLEHKK